MTTTTIQRTTVASPEPGPRNTILIGDASERLQQLKDSSIDTVLTSPPYFQLRNYGVAKQLGLELSVDDWIAQLLTVTDEVARVIVPTGTLWINLGDTYAHRVSDGGTPKSLLLGPERLAHAMVSRGWLLRNKIIWAKTNPMPVSVRDRLRASHEYVYVFTRSPRYFFDLDAIRIPHTSRPPVRTRQTMPQGPKKEAWRGPNSDGTRGLSAIKAAGLLGHPLGKNPGDVWPIATSRGHGEHHAAFPLELARRAIAAGCPERRCSRCRLAYIRPIKRLGATAVREALRPSCDCDAASEPGIVLDPFMGSGTTAIAAEKLHRDWLGIELNPGFARDARIRIRQARGSPPADARAV